jgi:hypothetical protein
VSGVEIVEQAVQGLIEMWRAIMARILTKEECTKRAIEDYSQFSQTLRAALQYVFAANGGAIIALLSCLTAFATAKDGLRGNVSLEAVIHSFSKAIASYLGGVFLVIVAACFISVARQYWGHFWEEKAEKSSTDFKHHYALKASWFGRVGFVFLALAGLMFIPGSFYAIRGFLP